jgi:hypothetical protein
MKVCCLLPYEGIRIISKTMPQLISIQGNNAYFSCFGTLEVKNNLSDYVFMNISKRLP